MKTPSSRFPEWSIDMNEVSAGVYQLQAVHPLGSRIDLTDESPSALLEKFESAAEQMNLQIRQKIA